MAEVETSPVSGVAAAGAAVSVAAALGWIGDLVTRPPCPPNFVRPFDVELLAPPALLIIGGISFAIFRSSRKKIAEGGTPGFASSLFALAFLGLASLLLAFSVVVIIGHRGSFDDSCWTF
jgi:hypothetical protein